MKIYKILTPDQWSAFQSDASFAGAPIDLSDGYIHFSTAEQAKETADKYFADHNDIVLLELDAEAFAENLKWEPSRGGALFPHLYATLSIESIQESWTMQRGSDGMFSYPDELN